MNSKKLFLACRILCFSLLLLGARCGEKPGEGEMAKKGYANAEPIVAALDNYYRDKQNYPRSLEELQPAYLEQIPRDENDKPYQYRHVAEKKSYELKFDYDAPGLGVCECKYFPELQKWFCSCLI